MRQRHDFSVTAYVVMPEHIHQLVSEPRARLLARRFRRLSLNQSSTYAYDGFNRLTGTSTGGSPAYSFVYDRWGNRLTQTALQGGTTSVLNINTANNQVTGTGSAPNSFTYDAAGNLTSDGAYTYTYDPDGNVLTVGTSSGTVTTTYTYDALNRRVRIQAARGTFEFAFDANGRRVSTWNAPGGSLSETLIYWGSQPVAFHTPPGGGFTHFQYQDWMGTERLRTSGSVATVEGTYQSLPYGDGYSASGVDYDWYHFAGQDFDPESSTQHAQFRQYASVQGRWMSPDPYDGSMDLGNPQSLNRYSYVLNNPMSYVDPDGLQTCNTQGCVGTDPNPGDPCHGDPTGCKPPPPPIYYPPDSCYPFCSQPPPNAPAHPGNPGNNGPGGTTSNPAPKKPIACTKPNLAQRLVVSALSKIAAFSNKTVGYGVGGSAGVGFRGIGISYSASQQLLVSPDGTAGLATTFTPQPFGFASTGAGALAGIQLTMNVNQTFADNYGIGVDAGVVIADGYAVGLDLSNSGATVTIGAGGGGYGHAGAATYTVVSAFCKTP